MRQVREDRPLDRDRAARGRDGGNDQRRDVTRAEREPAGRRGRPTATEERGPATGTAATARKAERLRDEAERSDCRPDRRELTRYATELTPEVLAARAVAHVFAGVGVRADAPVVRLHQVLADRRAGGLACLAGLGEREPRPDQHRFDRADGDPERARELRIGHAGELAHQQCRSLLIGQLANVLDQPAHRLAKVDLGERIVDR